jgi:hypothetical protein
LAPAEARIEDECKQRIVAAEYEDAIKVEFVDRLFPATSGEGGHGTLPGRCAPFRREVEPAGVETRWSGKWSG